MFRLSRWLCQGSVLVLIFAFVHYVAPLCLQWPLALPFPAAFAGSIGHIDIESLQNRLLKVCYVPTTSASLNRLLFLLRPLTVLMKQTRKAVRAIKQFVLLRCL
jgi:hypothetical protein